MLCYVHECYQPGVLYFIPSYNVLTFEGTLLLNVIHTHTTSEQDQVEATYMQRRFQGLSLAEQRRMEEQKRKKKKRFVSRRRSSAAESKASSTKLSPSTRRAKVRRVNPFGLQVSCRIIVLFSVMFPWILVCYHGNVYRIGSCGCQVLNQRQRRLILMERRSLRGQWEHLIHS